MNDFARQTLITLIAQHGPTLSKDPRRVEAFLRDLCGQHKREIFVLVSALKCRIAADLLNSKGVPLELLLARLTQRLEDETAVNTDAARWAVETWALALGVWGQFNSTRSMAAFTSSAESTAKSRPLPVTTPLKSLPRLYPSVLKKLQKITILSRDRILGDDTDEYRVSDVDKLISAAYAAGVKVVDHRPALAGEEADIAPMSWNDILELLLGSPTTSAEHLAVEQSSVLPLNPLAASILLKEMTFCYVPAGPFIMGCDEIENERPMRQVDISYDYWLGHTPVTVAQWRTFVKAADYKLAKPGGLRDPSNHPARYITWYDAVEFCSWLTACWQQPGDLPRDWEVRLPSEAEWEKGARGGLKIPKSTIIDTLPKLNFGETQNCRFLKKNPLPNRRYPWGNKLDAKRSNYSGIGIGNTSAVGRFPAGSSPYGCLDLAGNVWEWCATVWQDNYHDYQNDNTINRTIVPRVLRGGSFNDDDKWGIGCGYRSWNLPDDWLNDSGFRVCVVRNELDR